MRLLAISLFGFLLGWIIPQNDQPLPLAQDDSAYLVAVHPGFSLEKIMRKGATSLRSMSRPTFEKLVAGEPYFLVRLPTPAMEWAAWLRQHPGIRLLQRNHRVFTRETSPADPYWEEQWNLRRIGLPAVWEQTNGNEPGAPSSTGQIVVGILEKNGFDLDHPDLQDQVWRNAMEVPYDQIDNDRNGYTDDRQGWNFQLHSPHHPSDHHGTKVAGLLAARQNNAIGISGMSPNISFIPMSGLHYEHQIVQAYLYLRNLRRRYNDTHGRQGAYVVATNASFGVNYGHPQDYPIWCEVFDKLGEVGILSVSSVMNAPENIDRASDIPTSCASEFLITVTESDYEDDLPGDAAYGPQTVDLAAPGRGSFTTFPNNRYGAVSRGTSFAAPHVSGTIALLYQYMCASLEQEARTQPRTTALRTKAWLLKGVDSLAGFRQKTFSGGRVNAARSYQLMRQDCPRSAESPATVRLHHIFPNPFTQDIQLLLDIPTDQPITLQLLDMQGRSLFQQKQHLPAGENVQYPLHLGHLPEGVFTLIITSADGQRSSHRMVKSAPR